MKSFLPNIIILFLLLTGVAEAGNQTNDPVRVIFAGEKLFELSDVNKLSGDARKRSVTSRLKRFAQSPLINSEDFTVVNYPESNVSAVMMNNDWVVTIWDADAKRYNTTREQLAKEWCEKIKNAVEKYRTSRTKESYQRGIVVAIIATTIFVIVWFIISFLFKRETMMIDRIFNGKKMLKFVDGDSIISINKILMRTLRILIFIALFLFYIDWVLSLFPWTFNISAQLFHWVSMPFIQFGHAFVESIPDLFSLGVIILLVHLFLRVIKHIFKQIGEGKVRIRGFYQDWADTTYGLIRLVVIVFALVAAFPYIPGSNSPAFKGISIFVGVLFSLGSTSAVGNIVSGLILTYMRSFSPGDYVEIDAKKGTVMSRRMFSIRLKTPMNEIINLPNVSVALNPIINYSRMAKNIGVSIGTSVTIGYDVPWRTIHTLLENAAEEVPDILEDPKPNVIQVALNDFYVEYRLIVRTKAPEREIMIKSDLHKNIQDQFANAGIEILSPHYRSNRDGSPNTVPTFRNRKT